MIFIIDDRGNCKRATGKTSNTTHWGIYHRAQKEAPYLIEKMEDTIKDIVLKRYFDPIKRTFPNSTWLGKEILSTWEHKENWNDFCKSEELSSALFGEIMWTCMFDDENEWCTLKTPNANIGREERVYFIKSSESDY